MCNSNRTTHARPQNDSRLTWNYTRQIWLKPYRRLQNQELSCNDIRLFQEDFSLLVRVYQPAPLLNIFEYPVAYTSDVRGLCAISHQSYFAQHAISKRSEPMRFQNSTCKWKFSQTNSPYILLTYLPAVFSCQKCRWTFKTVWLVSPKLRELKHDIYRRKGHVKRLWPKDQSYKLVPIMEILHSAHGQRWSKYYMSKWFNF